MSNPNRSLSTRTRLLILGCVFSPAECHGLVKRAAAAGFAPARLTSQGRHNEEAFVIDAALADRLKGRLRTLADVIEVDDLFEVYRYGSGQRVELHSDGGRAIRRSYRSNGTVLTYLSDDFQGGRTVFPSDGLAVVPVLGHAVLFAHGVPHYAEIVGAGTKYVARSDVVIRQ